MEIKKVDLKKESSISKYLNQNKNESNVTSVNNIETVDLNYSRTVDDMDSGIAVQKVVDTKVDPMGEMEVYSTEDNTNADKIIDINISNETAHVATGNKDINQLREELCLFDGSNGNSSINNKFDPSNSDLTIKQTQLLNEFDSYCNEKGLTQQQKMDWAYMIGRESTFKTTAGNGTYYGIGQLSRDNIYKYSSNPDAYLSGDSIAQIDTTYKYIMDRYGSIEAAREKWNKSGSY